MCRKRLLICLLELDTEHQGETEQEQRKFSFNKAFGLIQIVSISFPPLLSNLGLKIVLEADGRDTKIN